MTCETFAKRMEIICRAKDDRAVKRDGLRLIMVELGNGVPGYLPALELWLRRLGGSLDGLGGTDGTV